MNTTVILFELRSLLRDRAFVILAALLLAAVVLGAANGMRWLHFQQQAIAHVQAEEIEKLDAAKAEAAAILSGQKAPPRGWWSNPADTRGFAYGFVTTYAIKPPGVLAPLAVGQTDLLPYYFKVNAGKRSGALASYEAENPRRLLLGRFDLAFVFVFLLPLLLLAAGYGALAMEREDGRLALLVTHGVSPRRIALTRVALRAGIFTILALIVALATLAVFGFDFTTERAVASLLEWCAVALAYALFWTAMTLMVVALARNTATAALSLAGIWLLLVVIAPWALNLAASVLYPLPSRTGYILAQRAAADAAEEQGSALLGRYLHDHPEFAPASTPIEAMHYSATDIATTEHIEAQLRPVQREFEKRLADQQRVIDRWQWLSPAVLAQQAFNEMAGAGWSRHRAFLAQADAHIDALRSYFNPRVLRGEFQFTAFDDWPRYSWHEPWQTEERQRVYWALLGLLLPAVALVAAAVAALGNRKRLDGH